MSAAVGALGVAMGGIGGAPNAAAVKPTDPALARAAKEFEAAFLRQILESAKIGGKDAKHGYGAMAVDALASGLEAGGGIGLGKHIAQALSRQHEAETVKPVPSAKRT